MGGSAYHRALSHRSGFLLKLTLIIVGTHGFVSDYISFSFYKSYWRHDIYWILVAFMIAASALIKVSRLYGLYRHLYTQLIYWHCAVILYTHVNLLNKRFWILNPVWIDSTGDWCCWTPAKLVNLHGTTSSRFYHTCNKHMFTNVIAWLNIFSMELTYLFLTIWHWFPILCCVDFYEAVALSFARVASLWFHTKDR